MKRILIVMTLVFIVFPVIFSLYLKENKIVSVILGGKSFTVEISDTDALRMKGLSGHMPLSDTGGMLFVFEKEGDYGFWMKEMLFPIDIIWIDKNFKINHIESRVSPETYPKAFSPSSPSLYVLEINSGQSESLKIKTGDEVKFIKK